MRRRLLVIAVVLLTALALISALVLMTDGHARAGGSGLRTSVHRDADYVTVKVRNPETGYVVTVGIAGADSVFVSDPKRR